MAHICRLVEALQGRSEVNLEEAKQQYNMRQGLQTDVLVYGIDFLVMLDKFRIYKHGSIGKDAMWLLDKWIEKNPPKRYR